MAERNETAGTAEHPLAVTRTELVWKVKYDSAGNPVTPLRVAAEWVFGCSGTTPTSELRDADPTQ